MVKAAILVNTMQSGGAERQSIILFNTLKREVPTTLIVFHPERIEKKMLSLIEGEDYNLLLLEGSIFKKFKLLRSQLEKNEITHLFNFLTKPNIIGAITGKLAKVKYIYGGVRTSKLPIWKFHLEKIIANYVSTETIFNSYAGASIYKEKGLKRTLVISNCFPVINKPIIKVSDLRKIKIISVGRFVEAKDYLTAILVIKFLVEKGENIQFTIVGYGVLEEQIRNWISKYNLDDHINLIINPNNIPELLDKSDIYLSTSLYEGTSNSIMEAMNASLPVVATNVGDNDYLVFEGQNGYLRPVSDFEALALAVQIILSNSKLRIDMGVESNNLLRENFSLEKFKDEYLKLLYKK